MSQELVVPQSQCAICKKYTTQFNYGVHSCNACKMFFRRAQNSKQFPNQCQNGRISCWNCRFCRLQRCLEVGMKVPELPRQSINLSDVLQHLKAMDDHRNNRFLSLITTDNPSLDEVIVSPGSVRYTQKPEHYEPEFYDWAFVHQTTSIEYMKQFDFVKSLSGEELKFFIKKSFMLDASISNAMRTINSRKDTAQFPGGIDIFPNEIKLMYSTSPRVLEKVRCGLIGRMLELKITNEEALLLGAIIICNPASHNFSKATQTLISQHQKAYCSALFQYCQNAYQQAGPSRFADLLSACHSINKSFTDFGNLLITYGTAQPNLQIKKIFIDLLNFVMM